MEQDGKPRDKPTHICSHFFLIKEARIYNGEKTASSISDAGNRTLPNTIHKNKLKMD